MQENARPFADHAPETAVLLIFSSFAGTSVGSLLVSVDGAAAEEAGTKISLRGVNEHFGPSFNGA